LFLVLFAATAARATPVDAVDDPIPSPTVPISDATDPISDTVSDATDPISDTVSDATDPISDTVSDATDPISDADSSLPGAAPGASRTGKASSEGQTSSRERSDVACDAQTMTCIQGPAESDGLAGVVGRIIGFLAQTGWAALPWIMVAIGLAVLGIFLLRISRHRTTSKT
jgi:hypothetical protein